MKKLPRALILPVLCVSFALFIQGGSNVEAADLSKFNPGRIIDDAVFYNKDAMTVTQIQSFLNSKVPVCETDTRPYPEAKAPCLKNYRETTKAKSADAYCNGYSVVNQSAAEIIYGVAQSCGVNPQVIIVTLQKEQGLVTDVWPRDGWLAWNCQPGNGCVNFQYRSAMGYGCPDTAACDSAYYGFFNQVYNAARQFKRYRALPTSYNFVAGRYNNIPWHPDTASCGYSSVYIENQATAGLYNYTPYRPNQAALNAYPGTGDYCSSYGNRNFYAFFTDWFGSAHSTMWHPMVEPRIMTMKENGFKYDPLAEGYDTSLELQRGQAIAFSSKTTLKDGTTCLRSSYDTQNNFNLCVALDALTEQVMWHPMVIPRKLVASKDAFLIDAISQEQTETILKQGTERFYTSKTSLKNGEACVRDNEQEKNGEMTCVALSDLQDVNGTTVPSPPPMLDPTISPTWTNMVLPRELVMTVKANKINPINGVLDGLILTVGQSIKFKTKLDFSDGTACLRSEYDTINNNNLCVKMDYLREK